MDKDLEKKIRIHQLYDLYGKLLTEKQKTAFEYYYLDDYSLSEIADILQVSRNAIHEQITTVTAYLEDYEIKLELLDKHEKRSKLIEKYKKNPEHSKSFMAFLQELEMME